MGGQPRNLTELVEVLVDLLNLAVPVATLLAFVAFVWGIAMFILNADNEEARTKGKQVMIWGIIALLVIATIGGILEVLRQTLFF